MNPNKYVKLFALLIFIALMLVSCWATVESLHFLLPDYPKVIFWIATIGSFFLASLGSKMIVDTFNSSLMIDHKGAHLLGGIILLSLFWFFFSLPTNTHTFFYKSVIKEELNTELAATKNQLENLDNDAIAKSIISTQAEAFSNKVNGVFRRFADEVNNPANEGWGPRAETAIIELEELLGHKIQRIGFRSNTHRGKQEVISKVRETVDQLLETKINEKYVIRMANLTNHKNKADIKKNIYAIDKIQNKIATNPNVSDEPTAGTNLVLTNSRNLILNYTDAFVQEFEDLDKNKASEAQQSIQAFKGVSRVSRLRSVIDVWKDFFDGKWNSKDFIFWIVMAALVDIAGFIFFSIAFKKEDY